MRKAFLFAFCLSFISLLLFGCEQKGHTTPATAMKTDKGEKQLIDPDFTTVSVSKTKGVDEVLFDDQASIDVFRSVFLSAVQEPGLVNMIDPQFYLDICNNHDCQSLYLWIGEKGQKSTLMKSEDTHTIYTVSEEKTEKLISFVVSRFN